MKTFVSYLIENNIITPEQLVETSVFQEKETTGVLELLQSKSHLSAEEICELINESSSTKQHILAVLEEKHPQKYDEFIIELSQTTPGLIQSLVHLEYGSKNDLEEAYREFQSLKETPTEDNQDLAQLSPAALESLKELGMDIGELENRREPQETVQENKEKVEKQDEETDYKIEYLNYFNHSRYETICSLLKSCKESISDENDFQNYLNSLFKQFHLLKGAARLDDLKLTHKLIDQFENLITATINSGSAGTDLFDEFHTGLEKAVTELWCLRNEVVSTGSEISYWKDEKRKFSYLDSIRSLAHRGANAA